MSRFRNIIKLPSNYLGIVRNLNRQKKFLHGNVEPLLREYESGNDGSLSEKDFIKIRKYYGLAVPAILGEAFAVLRNKPLSISERWLNTNQGIITGIFDDFFDDKNLSEEYIEQLVSDPGSIIPLTSNEKLFIDFYLKILSESTHPEQVRKYILKVHNNQVESIEQENPQIQYSRIWEITQSKGGNSVLFYRSAMDNIASDKEQQALFNLGTLMQLENDIFDVYKDNKSGIRTIPITTKKVSELRSLFSEQLESTIKMSYQMPYSRNHIRKFLDRLMPVINRGFVCLDQYQKLEAKNNGVFSPESFSRKELICDMESFPNILKTIYYQIKNTY